MKKSLLLPQVLHNRLHWAARPAGGGGGDGCLSCGGEGGGEGGEGGGEGGGSKGVGSVGGGGEGAGRSMIEPPQQEAIPVKSACELPDKMRTPTTMYMLSPCCMHSALQWYGGNV